MIAIRVKALKTANIVGYCCCHWSKIKNPKPRLSFLALPWGPAAPHPFPLIVVPFSGSASSGLQAAHLPISN